MRQTPPDGIAGGFDGFDRRQGWADHDHDLDAEFPRRRDLGVTGVAAAVLGDDDVDGVYRQQFLLVVEEEGTTCGDVTGVRQQRLRLDRVDAADEIAVLRLAFERPQLLPPQREKDIARRASGFYRRLSDVGGFRPVVPGAFQPWRTPDGENGDAGCPCCAGRVAGNIGGKGMGRIDEKVSPAFGKIMCEPVRAAEAADADRDRLVQGRFGPARKTERGGEFQPVGNLRGEFPGFRRSAEYEDAMRHG